MAVIGLASLAKWQSMQQRRNGYTPTPSVGKRPAEEDRGEFRLQFSDDAKSVATKAEYRPTTTLPAGSIIGSLSLPPLFVGVRDHQ